MSDPLFGAHDISKFYPGVKALDGVNLTLRAGEIHALVGENGAGKSSLIKIITGVLRPDHGKLVLDGQAVSFPSPRSALRAGVGAVQQERNLVPRYSIAENILLDRLPTRGGFVRRGAMHAEARRWLDMLELPLHPDTPVDRLSVAHMQMVEIARALSQQSRILLLDEPTASISAHEADRLFQLLRRLQGEGVAILFVSHKLEEVLALCQRITILRDGRNAMSDAPVATMSKADIVAGMIGRGTVLTALKPRQANPGAIHFELDDVSTIVGHAAANLAVRGGEVAGLYGLVGAGRSELIKSVLSGKVLGGKIRVKGAPAAIPNTRVAIRKYRIGYISEDRKNEGLILTHSVSRNASITIWNRIANALGLLTDRAEQRAVRPLLEQLDVKTPSLDQLVGNLSGGNQQKINVAKWLAARADTLIIDEPTVGVDVRAKGYLHQLIWDIAEMGVAVVLISSDMPELIQLADRIYVMDDYRLICEARNSHDYEEMSQLIMAHIQASHGQAGGKPPAGSDTLIPGAVL